MCIRDQALLYYRLLHCGIEETRKVLQGRRSDPSLGVLIGRPAEPISQWSGSFNTLEPLRQLSAVELESVSPQPVTFDPRPHSDLPDSFQCSSVVHSGESRHSSASRTIMAPLTNVSEDSSLSPPSPSSSPHAPSPFPDRSSAAQSSDSSSSVSAPISLSPSPTLSPEAFERTWLQLRRSPVDQGR